jgi:hypothetical protein
MSLFDSASLVVTPNGQKAGKLYSIKPTDGSGDLSVTRATSATRVDANGLVEIPRTNLLTNSDGNLATYTTNSNVSNAIVPINGFTNSIQFGDNSVSRLTYKRNFTPTIGIQYVLSVFVQMDDDSLPVVGSTNSTGDFSLIINGNTANINVLAQRVNDTNVYICSASFVATSTNTQFGVAKFATQSVKGFRITGIQLETGVSATEYIPTIASIRTKFAGITQDGSSASNIPRLDYTNGSCPSILVEPQRTNLALRSEEFDNAYWVKSAASIAANIITSPNDTITADKLIEDTSASAHRFISTSFSTLNGVSYTLSIFLKKAGRDYAYIRLNNSGGDIIAANINLLNGTVSQSIFGNITIVPYNNDWYRVIATGTSISTSNGTFEVRTSNSATYANYTGNGTDGIYVWGGQLEAGANATSYIPTTSASVTRNADVISKTGISSLIGQTEGTIFADVNIKRIGIPIRTFTNLTNGTTNFINLSFLNTNVLRVTIRANAGTQYNVSTSALPIGRYKLAATYKAGELKLYVNGVLIGTNTNASVSWSAALDRLNLDNSVLGTDNFSDDINLVSHWKTALTGEECINLTTI